MKIGDRQIGSKEKPFIIAEAGINHNGNINKAFEMIELAKKIGVDSIKFQTFKAEEFVFDHKQEYTYQSQGKTITESMLEMFKRCEFTKDEWYQIKQKCEKEDIIFLSTPQNHSDLELLLDLGIPAIKVGSDDFTNLELLKQYSATGLPLLLSCGMADLAEIYTSLNEVTAFENYPVALLLCTSQYPTPSEDVNLLKLKTLGNAFPELVLGFSDHTQDNIAAGMAVGFGACVFEKHFTLSHDLPGPDHWFSEDPHGLKLWHDTIIKASIMLGKADVKPTKEEERMKILMRRSIVVTKDLQVGEIFDRTNLGIYRPGDGLPAKMLNEFIGKKVRHDLKRGHLIQWEDVD